MDRRVFVYVDIQGTPHLVGRLWSRFQRGRETASFSYDPSWLAHEHAFSLEPALTLDIGQHHTSQGKTLFGAFGDSAPDRWGRVLMRRAERVAAKQQDRSPRTLGEIDYLLMVNDESRLGALRFAEKEGGPFLETATATPIPPLVDLPRLLAASDHVLADDESHDDLRLLLAPGSSLGGARPKASIRDRDGHLAIAKFPHPVDEMNVESWEAVAMSLAKQSGITVPEHRLETIAGRSVLILQRFDRTRKRTRIPFLSAMSMLGAQDNETRSYLEIADAISRYGASPDLDRADLWRRIVFNILISNTDDHLRNHAFLYQLGKGWKLSPAYDLNPVPVDIKPRVLTTSIGFDDPTASIELAMENASYFGLSATQAKEVAREVARTTRNWRTEAERLGLRSQEIERMASAFEHVDSQQLAT